jgi:hypothetical protein
LAPGVYLLSSGERSDAAAVLRKAGIDIISQPPLQAAGKWPGIASSFGAGGRYFRHFFDRPSSSGIVKTLSRPNVEEAASSSAEADSIQENFRRVLEKMHLPKLEREELAARIERRLVLSNAQLESVSLRYEKLEARGLDYAGKSLIAKQAIEAGSLLDVSWPGAGGVINRVIGKPKKKKKKDKDNILVLKNTDAAAGDTVRVPLGKISLLRRIKQSIFEG